MRKIVIAVGLASVLAAGGCSSSSTPTDGQGSPTSIASETDVTTRHYGLLKDVAADPNTVSFKEYEYFSGAAAEEAAKEDGQESFDDYYVRDLGTPEASLSVDGTATVNVLKMDGGSSDSMPVTYADFVKMFNSSKDPGALSTHGYWLTLSDGTVSAIEEQFSP